MRLAHYLTIGSECSTAIACHLEKLYVILYHTIVLSSVYQKRIILDVDNMKSRRYRNMEELGWDARVALSVYGAFNSREYLNAQKVR